jgi:hypothetical protein
LRHIHHVLVSTSRWHVEKGQGATTTAVADLPFVKAKNGYSPFSTRSPPTMRFFRSWRSGAPPAVRCFRTGSSLPTTDNKLGDTTSPGSKCPSHSDAQDSKLSAIEKAALILSKPNVIDNGMDFKPGFNQQNSEAKASSISPKSHSRATMFKAPMTHFECPAICSFPTKDLLARARYRMSQDATILEYALRSSCLAIFWTQINVEDS